MTENRNNVRQNCALHMEKAKRPSFNGTIRENPQFEFKQDFKNK